MHRATDLALTIIQELSGSLAANDESGTKSHAREVFNLLFFLWAAEKSCTNKVTLGEHPSLKLFNNRYQGILEKLSPRKVGAGQQVRRSPLPSQREDTIAKEGKTVTTIATNVMSLTPAG